MNTPRHAQVAELREEIERLKAAYGRSLEMLKESRDEVESIKAAHDKRVTELLEANNVELEKRHELEHTILRLDGILTAWRLR